MSSSYADFGKKLEYARLQHNLTQSDLAKQLKISQQTISYWEAGKVIPSLKKLEQILGFFSINPKEREDWFLSANYQTNKKQSIQPANIVSFVPSIPFSALSPENFEKFVCDLLQLLYPSAKTHQHGSQGHKQDGIDITQERDDSTCHDFQCKCVRQFGPAQVKAAVECYTRYTVCGFDWWCRISKVRTSG